MCVQLYNGHYTVLSIMSSKACVRSHCNLEHNYYDTITQTLYRPSLNSKHTALSLDLLSTGNSNKQELKEVVARAVSNQRVGKFRFKPSFPKDWWRVIRSSLDSSPVSPSTPSCPSQAVGCRADTDIICPGSQCRRPDTRDTALPIFVFIFISNII